MDGTPHEPEGSIATANRLHRHGGTKTAGIGLLIGALGVVYGDIGTSPLYSVSEVFFGKSGIAATEAHALGTASLVFWALVLVVTVKYVVLIMRADNDGEGGIFAMLGLLLNRHRAGGNGGASVPPGWLVAAVLVGAALLYGDGMITPAISVLSAVEGLKVVSPAFEPWIVPVTVAILAGLFALQKRGTHRIGWLFGPVMTVWFAVIGILGAWHVAREPSVLAALSPWYALVLLRDQGFHSLHILGSVVLCVTGVEAMYADMGHFGRRAITRAWLFLVFPCLILNYLGQAAFLVGGQPVPNDHLFYALAPSWGTGALVAIATVATVIASQALISGAFSLTQQATSLGLFPRLKVVHTNPDVPGQIYLPFINFVLFLGCVGLVLQFRSSTNLAAAYGLAVTGTMLVTSIVFGKVALRVWHWRLRWLVPVLALIVVVDVSLFSSNLLKLADGGYVPLLIGFLFLAVMDTWRWGRKWIGLAYQRRSNAYHLKVGDLIADREKSVDPSRSMSLVVMTSRPISKPEDLVPPVLAIHYRNWSRVPRHLVFFSVVNVGSPTVPETDRFKVIELLRDGTGTIVAVHASYGYMEQPDIRRALTRLKRDHRLRIPQEPRKWLILIGAERFVTPGRNFLEKRRISLFSRMNRLAKPVTDYFGLQSDAGLTIETINV
jgi:KUP system potassium uptake protein